MREIVTNAEPEADFSEPRPAFENDGSLFEKAQEMSTLFSLSLSKSIEILEWAEETGMPGMSRSGGIRGTLPQWMKSFVKILVYIKNHLNPIGFFCALRVWDDRVLDDINRNLSPSAFAKIMGVTKQAVNEAEDDARRNFNRPPRRDQRQAEAREKMAVSRLAQLDGNGNGNHQR